MMKKLAVLTTVALISLGAAAAPQAQARDGRNAAIAAGVIGGLAAGALLGAAVSDASAAPASVYGYAPVTEGYAVVPAPAYETTRVVRRYDVPDTYVEEYAPRRVYRTTRVVRTYDSPVAYGDDCPPERAYTTTRVVRSYGYAPAREEYSWGGPGRYGW
jgi:hypothetical protein